MIDISFCVITNYADISALMLLIESIRNQSINNYEIIIVGGIPQDIPEYFKSEDIVLIDFNEFDRPGWITRKKNLAVQNSNYQYCLMLHDYFMLSDDWYQGLCKFINDQDDWSAITNKIFTMNGNRFRLDWVCLSQPYLDYSETPQDHYISGGFFFTKRELMIKYPFNEDLLWNQQEDIQWCSEVKKEGRLLFNPYGSASLLKIHREG
jgi:hypothetical protein